VYAVAAYRLSWYRIGQISSVTRRNRKRNEDVKVILNNDIVQKL